MSFTYDVVSDGYCSSFMELKARLILKVLAFVSAIIASSEERVTGQIVVDYMILSLDDHSWNSSTHESRRGVDEGRERRKKEGGWRGEGERKGGL